MERPKPNFTSKNEIEARDRKIMPILLFVDIIFKMSHVKISLALQTRRRCVFSITLRHAFFIEK